MDNNRNKNNYINKNRYNNNLKDLSNNRFFLNPILGKKYYHDKTTLQNSRDDDFLFIKNKNQKLKTKNYLNYKPNNLIMDTPRPSSRSTKLIEILDKEESNRFKKEQEGKIEREKKEHELLLRKKDRLEKEYDNILNERTELLLKFILDESDKEFNSNFSNPYYSDYKEYLEKPLLNNEERNNEENIKNLLEQEKPIIKEKILINASIDNLIDLINLCDKYPISDDVEYNINMQLLHNIKPDLLELQNMIGMKTLKENIVDQILYFIQDLHNVSPNNSDYLHAVIYGPPGTGKTEVAKIMGKIFSNLGILKKNVFKKVTRDDLVAGYLGQTALKTKEVITECLGGVLFIDEAYALGNSEKKDSFSKESIDTICEALSNYKNEFMCIIAGYEEELKSCFFSYNPGLESRFTWKFKIDEYSPEELRQIFEKKIVDCGWKLKEPLTNEWFEKNKEFFTYFGRDMEILFSKVKIAHSRRVFCLPKEEKTLINFNDLVKGFEIYQNIGKDNKQIEIKKERKRIYESLYC